jgi:hypothetical protein
MRDVLAVQVLQADRDFVHLLPRQVLVRVDLQIVLQIAVRRIFAHKIALVNMACAVQLGDVWMIQAMPDEFREAVAWWKSCQRLLRTL